MTISRKEVEQVARLAHLSVSTLELDELTGDLDSILDHMKELADVDTAEVAPMGGVSDHPAPMREDEVRPDGLNRSAAEVAPHWEEGFFVVPRLAALDGDAVDGEGAP